MEVEYKLGESIRVTLNAEDIGSLATSGYCTIRKGLVGHESKTWVRQSPLVESPQATIDGGPDLYIDIPSEQIFPFTVTKDAISAFNGDQGMVDWFFHDGSEIVVE